VPPSSFYPSVSPRNPNPTDRFLLHHRRGDQFPSFPTPRALVLLLPTRLNPQRINTLKHCHVETPPCKTRKKYHCGGDVFPQLAATASPPFARLTNFRFSILSPPDSLSLFLPLLRFLSFSSHSSTVLFYLSVYIFVWSVSEICAMWISH